MLAAVRDLREETGIQVSGADLTLISRCILKDAPAIYYSYLARIGWADSPVTLQEGETSDYRFLPYEEFKAFVRTDAFSRPLRERFARHEALFDQAVYEAEKTFPPVSAPA